MSNKSNKCTECGRVIPKARLKAVPDTTHCVACAEIVEEENPKPILAEETYSAEDCLDILRGGE